MEFVRRDRFYDLTVPVYHNYLCQTIAHHNSNRAGKTLGALAEVARCLTNQDPHGKWPRAGVFHLIGLDERHVADVFYKGLFRADPFRMIRDEGTGAWRVYRPWADRRREAESKPAPPLIPARFVQERAWKDKKRGVPSLFRLTTGWEVHFMSSKGSPAQGTAVDGVLIDEEIENDQFYAESVRGMATRGGRLIWSATPQIATQQLYDLHARAEEGDPDVGEHVVLLEDNPYIPGGEKDKLAARYTSDEERRVRILGEFALTGYLVYPSTDFGVKTHGLRWDGPPPADWCRYMTVDPGRQVCAVLFAAVPPPGTRDAEGRPLDDSVVLYDELYLKSCTADLFGEQVARKALGLGFEAFLIDKHGSNNAEIGTGLTVEQQFKEQLRRRGVKCRRTGHGFTWGSDDPDAGIQAVREAMRVRPALGTPRLRVLCDAGTGECRLPHWKWEVERYHYQKIKGLVTDRVVKKNDHLMDDTRYLVMSRPYYRRPEKARPPAEAAWLAFRAKQKKRRKGEGPGFVRLGPGG